MLSTASIRLRQVKRCGAGLPDSSVHQNEAQESHERHPTPVFPRRPCQPAATGAGTIAQLRRRPGCGRSRPPPGGARLQPIARAETPGAAAALAAAVPQRPAVHDAVRLAGHRAARLLGGQCGNPPGGGGQRADRFRPGGQGGQRAGRHPRHAFAACPGPARRPAPGAGRRTPGTGRRGAAGLRRPGAGRPAAVRNEELPCRRVGPDRRVGAGGEGLRRGGHRRVARRPPLHGLFRHPGDQRPGARSGGRHRRGYRTGPDRYAVARSPHPGHSAAATDRQLQSLAGPGDPAAGRRHLRPRHPLAGASRWWTCSCWWWR